MSSSADVRWVSVGHSDDSDPSVAGARATEAAITSPDPKLLVVFCSQAYDLEKLLGAINQASGDVPLIGCSTAGEIATPGPGEASVVVTAIGGDGFEVATAAAGNASADLRSAGARVASAIDHISDAPHKVVMLLSDGLAGDQQEIVRGAHRIVGSGIPLVGGCAGDDLKMEATYQLHGHDVMTNAVVGAAVGSSAPFGIGVRHGWRRVGEPMLVTRSAGNRVYALDDRPALDVYLERLNAPEEAHNDHAAFTQFALTHPLGLSRRTGEDHVRFVGGGDFKARALECIAEVPQGGMA